MLVAKDQKHTAKAHSKGTSDPGTHSYRQFEGHPQQTGPIVVVKANSEGSIREDRGTKPHPSSTQSIASGSGNNPLGIAKGATL